MEKQRKFLLILPILILPFLSFLLWSVGLLGNTKTKELNSPKQQGFNRNLPNAKLKENKGWNKLTFYQQADRDSARYREQMKNDPYFSGMSMDSSFHKESKINGMHKPDYDPSPNSNNNFKDPNEEKVNNKLAELNAALNKSTITRPISRVDYPIIPPSNSIQHKEVDRLENMLQAISQKDTSADPEMQQLGGMMDKILDIQHPERINERIQLQSQKNKQEVFPVAAGNNEDNISLLQNKESSKQETSSQKKNSDSITFRHNGFYSLEENSFLSEQQNAIEAEINETQTLVSGSTVKLRLENEVYINGILVPKNNFVFGIASLNGERLNIHISTIRYHQNILPVSLSVYDMDGLSGIFVPGAITRDVAKQSADESVQGIGLTSLDPSIGAQAASAGIQAAKSLISKKVKLIKVTVKVGYHVLLKDNNNKQ